MAVKQSFLGIDQEEVDVSLVNPMPVTDFAFQIQLGNVEGYELRNVAGEKHNVDTNWQDISEVDGIQTLPTEGNPEEWEILSTSTEDDDTGSGTETVLLPFLGDGWVEEDPVIATVNGTTPTLIPGGANKFRAGQAVITTPSGGSNVGDIIIRVAGGGDQRVIIRAGEGVSKSSFFSVPDNKTAFAQFIIAATAKNQDMELRSHIQSNGGPIITGGTIPTYQGAISWPIVAPFTLPGKTDIRFQVRSTNDSTAENPIEVISFLDLLIVDNTQIQDPVVVVTNYV